MEVFAIFVLAGLACAAAQTECVPEPQEQKALSEVLNALDAFAINLYQELRIVEEGNLVVCPLSAAVVLALTWTGARGRSAQQLGDALHLLLNRERVADGFGALLAALPTSANQSDETAFFQFANALFVQSNFIIKEDFMQVAIEYFRAGVEELNFGDSKYATNYINQWVANNTNDRIQDLIPEGTITVDTRLVLVNTLLFSALWANPFQENQTSNQTFYLSDNEQIDVPMMHGTFRLDYSELPDFNATALRLPYESRDFESDMVILLPNSATGLKALEKNLGQLDISSIPFQTRRVAVSLPSFTIETSLNLKEILQQLGVTDIFDGNLADLSGISTSALFVNEAVQKVYISVNENGTEATAATAVIVDSRSVTLQDIKFEAIHPFFFFLRIEKINAFTGKVVNPIE